MTRLVIVAAAAIGLILFAAFVVARLLQSRTRGMSIRMQVFVALALIVGACPAETSRSWGSAVQMMIHRRFPHPVAGSTL